MSTHRPRVYRIRFENGVWYKWAYRCTCGARGLSWSWSRAFDAQNSGLPLDDWVRDNGEPLGGAYPMALDHLGLLDPPLNWQP